MDLRLYFICFWNDLNGIRYGTSPPKSCVFLENRLEEDRTFFMGGNGITLTRVPFNRMSLLKEIVQCLFRVKIVSDASIRSKGAVVIQ
jgi:hypothetical protein